MAIERAKMMRFANKRHKPRWYLSEITGSHAGMPAGHKDTSATYHVIHFVRLNDDRSELSRTQRELVIVCGRID